MGKVKDLIGSRFGRLIVICRAPNDSMGRTVWRCKCDCGNIKDIRSTNLCEGLIKSCGCLRHGLRNTRLYTIWSHMKQRCENPRSNRFRLYGARGIKVCSEWRNDFKRFYDWAMSNGYSDDLSIDRIDGDGNYEPQNCRWATVSEQNKNRRHYHLKSKCAKKESSNDE